MVLVSNYIDSFSAYKLHDKIGKALKTRAEAIRHALETYNAAAAQLNPPHEGLMWAKLMDATTLAEFDLLCDSCQDIRQQPWTQPARREAMNLYFGIKRTKEEIVQLNVEIRHLITFMIDDHHDFYSAIVDNIIVDPALACELSCQWEFRSHIHSQIAYRLCQTSRLKGFTGILTLGTREGHSQTFALKGGLPYWAGDIFGLAERYEEIDEIENDEELLKEVVADSDLVVQLLKNISMQDDIDLCSNP
jgi:hypothetical protein